MRWPFRAPEVPSGEAAAPAAPVAAVPDAPSRERRYASWDLADGAELAPGRHALRRLGGGSRYEVYLVWDDRLFALAVAKLLRPDQVTSPRALRELAREAELVQRLAHPALVRGFGAVAGGERPHLLLEHVEGPTLERLVKRHGPLPLDQLLPLALHVVAVLQFLAAERVVHLDLKPGNVVMSAPPRVIDLSIARTFEEAAALRQAIGTDAYMAPEQCAPSDAAPVGPAADVFALGATLHHALAGEVPFPRAAGARHAADPEVRFPQLVREPAALPGAVPAPLREVVRATLAREPAARPSPRDVAEALEPLVSRMPARRVTTNRRGRPIVR